MVPALSSVCYLFICQINCQIPYLCILLSVKWMSLIWSWNALKLFFLERIKTKVCVCVWGGNYFYIWLIYYAGTKDVTLHVQGLFPYTPHLAHFIVPECILFIPPTKNTGTSLGRNPTLEESAPPMGVVSVLFFKHAMALHYTHTAMESRCALNGANQCQYQTEGCWTVCRRRLASYM